MNWKTTRMAIAALMISIAAVAQDSEPKDLVAARAEYVKKLETLKKQHETKKDPKEVSDAFQSEIDAFQPKQGEDGITILDGTVRIDSFEFVDNKTSDKVSTKVLKPDGAKDLKFVVTLVLPQNVIVTDVMLGIGTASWSSSDPNRDILGVEGGRVKHMLNKDYTKQLGTFFGKTDLTLYAAFPKAELKSGLKANLTITLDNGNKLSKDYTFDKIK